MTVRPGLRTRGWVTALAISGLTVAVFVSGILLHRGHIGGPNILATVLNALSLIAIGTFLAFPAMGLLLVRHRPGNAIGWLLLGLGLNIYLIFNTANFAVLAQQGNVPVVGAVFAFFAGTAWIPFTLMLLLFLPMLFPSGHLLSRRWYLPIIGGGLFALLALLGNMFVTSNPSPGEPAVINPLANASLARTFQPFINLAVPFALFALLGSWTSVVVRYRRGDSLQRHQLRWFLFALVLAAMPFLLHDVNQTVANAALLLFVPLLPVSIAIAVLRYRLYDIDVVINRALVYGALAGFITAVYIGIVVGVGRVIGSGNRPNLALSIVATAVVAVAFQPVRERVQRFANRLVYGQRATPYEVMAGFADRMAGTLSADEVLPQMAEAAARGVGARAARVALRLPDGAHHVTTWPNSVDDQPFTRILPVVYKGEAIGEIAVRKSPGETVTPGEERLLADLAAQAGLVLNNVRLTEELQARLVDLSAQATELRASRQRIMSAQETERRRLGAQIRSGVQRELEATSAQLDDVQQLLAQDGAAAAKRLDALTLETQHTLDGLRELARGIYPPLLADRGIVPALEAHARRAGLFASIEASPEFLATRFDPSIEVATFFCCLEALRGADAAVAVRLFITDGTLGFDVDGVAPANGRLEGIRDRVEALGGRLGQPTPGFLAGRVPLKTPELVG